jgi:hypothetical protein
VTTQAEILPDNLMLIPGEQFLAMGPPRRDSNSHIRIFRHHRLPSAATRLQGFFSSIDAVIVNRGWKGTVTTQAEILPDNLMLIPGADLFPPSKSARGGHLYTFKYLHGLRRRQMLCSRQQHDIVAGVSSIDAVIVNRGWKGTVTTQAEILPEDLPVEIQIRIFAYSGITDFHPLRLVCKAFYQLLTRKKPCRRVAADGSL